LIQSNEDQMRYCLFIFQEWMINQSVN